MIFEIAAGIVLGLFAFIVICIFWQALLSVTLWIILATVIIIAVRDPNSQFARIVFLILFCLAVYFGHLCVKSTIEDYRRRKWEEKEAKQRAELQAKQHDELVKRFGTKVYDYKGVEEPK